MTTSRGILGAIFMVLAHASEPAAAQEHAGPTNEHASGQSAKAVSPYVGMERRTVKALSDQQLADLKMGRGMGLALPAELNGYPGPLHVLQLADDLWLTAEQRAHTKSLIEMMKTETIAIGERIIADETMLDQLFATSEVTRESLEVATKRIGTEQGALRAAHLRYHLIVKEMLSAPQVAVYIRLRGYNPNGVQDHGRH